MKIVDRYTLLSLPPGTFYQPYNDGGNFGALCILQDSADDVFLNTSFTASPITVDKSEDVDRKYAEMEEAGISHPVNFEQLHIYPFGNKHSRFAVWEKGDLEGLMKAAGTALSVDPETVREREAEAARKADIEQRAKTIFESWADQSGYVPWVEGGNSEHQQRARQYARLGDNYMPESEPLTQLYPTHPGEVLKDDVLPSRGVTEQQLATGTGIAQETIAAILAGESPITEVYAVKIGKFLDYPVHLLVNMQKLFDEAAAKRNRV